MIQIERADKYTDLLKTMLNITVEDAKDTLVVHNCSVNDTQKAIVVELAGASEEDVRVTVSPGNLCGLDFMNIKIMASFITGYGMIKKDINTTIRVSDSIKTVSAKLSDGLLIIKYDFYENKHIDDIK